METKYFNYGFAARAKNHWHTMIDCRSIFAKRRYCLDDRREDIKRVDRGHVENWNDMKSNKNEVEMSHVKIIGYQRENMNNEMSK